MSDYANPDALVTTDWVRPQNLGPAIKIVEVDEDTDTYTQGSSPRRDH